jgi:hypothetical protein
MCLPAWFGDEEEVIVQVDWGYKVLKDVEKIIRACVYLLLGEL